jgi:DNA-binding transcriptional MerR regulator
MYVAAEQVVARLNLSPGELQQFEAKGVISAVLKSGRTYYSSRDIYRLKGILHFMRTKGMSLDKARERIDGLAGVDSGMLPGR